MALAPLETVAVLGLGTVGETLVETLLAFRETLGIGRVVVLRRAVPGWDEPRVRDLEGRGITVATEADDDRPSWSQVTPTVTYLFDCGPNGHALANADSYDAWPALQGICAQGSETGFGVPYLLGQPAPLAGERRVQVVSCNTHAIGAILQLLAGDALERLGDADIVVVRRSEDLGRHERLVGATVIARHRDPSHGTHHAVDVARAFRRDDLPLVSSDVTTPTQLMHAVRFRVRARGLADLDLDEAVDARPWLARTQRFDSNALFEVGRRHGFQGRVWAHAVLATHDVLRDGDLLTGWAFVPQECNTIPSSIAAMLGQAGHPDVAGAMATLAAALTRPVW